MAEILVVDDERTIRKPLVALLESEGYSVREARGGREALALVAERRPDLVLLDVMMPDMNGTAVCGELRKTDPVLPIVFLTAKDDDVAELRGFGAGCDDYISKSAPDELLLARLGRLVRRTAAAAVRPAAVITLGGVTVDLDRRTVTDGGEVIARLRESETDVLRLLASDRGYYFTLGELVAELSGADGLCGDTAAYQYISRLRRKLGRAGGMIDGRRGAGYCLLK